MKNELYSKEFYNNRYEITSYAADFIFKLLIEFKISFNSIIDFGCSEGTLLSIGK